MKMKLTITEEQLDNAIRSGIVTEKNASLVRTEIRKCKSFFRSEVRKTRSYFVTELAGYLLNKKITEPQFEYLVNIPMPLDEMPNWDLYDQLTGKLLPHPIPGPIVVKYPSMERKYPSTTYYTPDGRVRGARTEDEIKP